ncbi:MAG: ATP-binding protein [Actinomycetales bacterium]|nr:ATP-binding protein [Actinomycetales bacterium]
MADTPVVVIQGARQVGKSTLAHQFLAASGAPLISLDAHAVLAAARNDPDSFVRQRPGSIMAIDEVQRAPELLVAIKAVVDADPRPGQFLLTGSADLLRMPGQHESLAGRAETIELYGLSQGELSRGRDDLAERLFASDETSLSDLTGTMTRSDYLSVLCEGSFPVARVRTGRRRQAWFDNYLTRIVDRDARDISRLSHLDRLPRIIRLLAANSSGELVKARMAADVDIPETSIQGYLNLLQSLYLIQVLPAWSGNLTQRIVGRPKIALLDTGLAARLKNLAPAAMEPGAAGAIHAGSLLETFVAGELRRQSTWSVSRFNLHHFRDRNGKEVDIILENDERAIVGIEVKAAASAGPRDFTSLAFLRDNLGRRFRMGAVLYTGQAPVRFGERLWALPVSSLWT